MDYKYLNSKMKNLCIRLYMYKDFLNIHQEKINQFKISKLPYNSKIKCSLKNCPKNASYVFGQNSYCWFHKININNVKNHNLILHL